MMKDEIAATLYAWARIRVRGRQLQLFDVSGEIVLELRQHCPMHIVVIVRVRIDLMPAHVGEDPVAALLQGNPHVIWFRISDVRPQDTLLKSCRMHNADLTALRVDVCLIPQRP